MRMDLMHDFKAASDGNNKQWEKFKIYGGKSSKISLIYAFKHWNLSGDLKFFKDDTKEKSKNV